MKKISIFIAFLLVFGILTAIQNSPIGKWKTIDDKTGKAKSIVLIWEENGVLFGKIEKLFRAPDEEQNPLCEECKGINKDKPIIGMKILKNLKKHNKIWKGGTILDPKNGKVYKCRISLIDSGKKLKLRGFIGIPTLGRTQFWERIE